MLVIADYAARCPLCGCIVLVSFPDWPPTVEEPCIHYRGAEREKQTVFLKFSDDDNNR